MQLRWIDGPIIHKLITAAEVIDAVREAFIAYGRGEARMPPKVYLDVPAGDFRAMPAALPGMAGIKWVSVHTGNPQRNPPLPTVMGLLILNDPETGQPIALMDGTIVTRLRTGAAAAVATRALARPNSKTLGIIGCGGQAPAHIDALLEVFPQAEVLLSDARPEKAEKIAALYPRDRARVVDTHAAAGADVVTTLTSSRKPYIKHDWIRPGTHINAMGADAMGKQELATDLTLSSRVFVDDWTQASHSGEINIPVHDGEFAREDLAGLLADVLCGTNPGRRNEDEITIFDSTGLAIQDMALGAKIYAAAKAANQGQLMEMHTDDM